MTTLLVYLLVLLFPTQLGLHFWPQWSYLYGLRLDYLSPILHLTDLLLVCLFISNLKSFTHFCIHHQRIVLPLLLIVATNTFFSLIPFNTLLTWFRYLLLFNLALVVMKIDQRNLKKIFTLLSLSTVIISLIGISQFLKQSSLDGPFYYLGERHFNLSTPDIAKTTYLSSNLYLRPYSTFSHPNSLAGYLVTIILLLITLPHKLKPKKTLFYLTLSLSLIVLFLTFSRTALTTLLLLFPFYLFKISPKKITLLIIPLFTMLMLFIPTSISTDPSLTQRLTLAQASLKIIITSPITGTGLNNFIPALTQSTSINDFRLLQPVHNIYLLLISELGLIITILTIFFISRNKKLTIPLTLPLLAILLTGSFDHYWLTLPQNQLLFFLVLGFTVNKSIHKKPA